MALQSKLSIASQVFQCQSGLVKALSVKNQLLFDQVRKLELSRLRDIKVETQNSDQEDEDEDDELRGLHSSAVTAIDVDTQEGRYILAGGADGSLYIHDIANFSGEPKSTSRLITQKKPVQAPQQPAPLPRSTPRRPVSHHQADRQNGHWQSVQTVQWYPTDSGVFVTSGMDQRLLVWDANSMEVAETFDLGKPIFCHQISQTPSPLISVGTSTNHIRLIDLKSGSSTHELRGHKDSVLTVRWSDVNDYLLATGSYDGQVLLWDVRRARGCINCFDMNNVGRSTVTTNNDSCKAHTGSVNGVAFCDDGIHLVTYGAHEAKLRRWNLITFKNKKTPFVRLRKQNRKNKFCAKMSITSSYGQRGSLVFVPEGSSIASIDVNTGKLIHRLRGHYNGVHCTVFNDVWQELYSGGGDHSILVWEFPRHEEFLQHLKETDRASEPSSLGDSEV